MSAQWDDYANFRQDDVRRVQNRSWSAQFQHRFVTSNAKLVVDIVSSFIGVVRQPTLSGRHLLSIFLVFSTHILTAVLEQVAHETMKQRVSHLRAFPSCFPIYHCSFHLRSMRGRRSIRMRTVNSTRAYQCKCSKRSSAFTFSPHSRPITIRAPIFSRIFHFA